MTDRDLGMKRARELAHRQRAFYGHLLTYALVCALLVAIDVAGGAGGSTFIGLDWAYWPILGWGIFVVIDGLQLIFPASGWEERMAEELYDRERRREHQRM